MKRLNSIIRTWAAAIYELLKAEEEWWLLTTWIVYTPGGPLQSVAFSHADAEDILTVADCTNVICQSSNMLELIQQQLLYSKYYCHTVKY